MRPGLCHRDLAVSLRYMMYTLGVELICMVVSDGIMCLKYNVDVNVSPMGLMVDGGRYLLYIQYIFVTQ